VRDEFSQLLFTPPPPNIIYRAQDLFYGIPTVEMLPFLDCKSLQFTDVNSAMPRIVQYALFLYFAPLFFFLAFYDGQDRRACLAGPT